MPPELWDRVLLWSARATLLGVQNRGGAYGSIGAEPRSRPRFAAAGCVRVFCVRADRGGALGEGRPQQKSLKNEYLNKLELCQYS